MSQRTDVTAVGESVDAAEDPREAGAVDATPKPPKHAELDADVETLHAHAQNWARLPIRKKIRLLANARARILEHGAEWVELSVRGKQIPPDSPWVGEEWISGPWALAAGLAGFEETLDALAARRMPALPGVRTRAGGQVVADVFPANRYDSLLMNGITAEVWMQPEVTEANLEDNIAAFYRQPSPRGAVALVLGAGNVNSIAPLDVLHRLITHGQVVLLKMNPVNGYLVPVLAKIFADFISAGYMRIVSGGGDVGAYLTAHAGIDEIHITGSERTHDAIVYGPGADGAQRKARGEQLLDKPITSELGGIGPVIVVPGPWNDADLAYQAENIATIKLQNTGANCVAGQVLITAQSWDKRSGLLDSVRDVIRDLPPRTAYYPGVEDRLEALRAAHPDAEDLGGGSVPRTLVCDLDAANPDQHAFTQEFFGPFLAETALPGASAVEFLRNAVRFANDSLHGTLGVTILVHPATAKKLGDELDQALADLRYGAIGVNMWNAGAFLIQQAAWGAFPGHTYDDIGSGIGFVHNTFLLDKPQKTVVRGSFYAFPRGVAHRDLGLLPKPPWFVTNKTAAQTGRLFAEFAADPRIRRIPPMFAAALRG